MMQEDFSKYNGEGTKLRQAQICMLNIMVEVDKICRKNNIPYWLDSGTLIGAVRHGRFIPWDDDIDICILEKDYKRLREALIKELPSRYIFCDSKTDQYFFDSYGRIKDTLTVCHYPLFSKQKSQGLWLDIITLIPATSKRYKSIVEFIYGRVYRELHNFSKSKGLPLWRCKANKVMAYLLYPLAISLKIIGNYAASIKEYHALMPNWGSSFNSRRYIDDIFPLIEIKFENKYFFAPHNYDSYLTKIYGDYMQIPPEEKREQILDLSKIEFYDE